MNPRSLDGAHLFDRALFADERGFFSNIAVRRELSAFVPNLEIHQVSLSRSASGVLRGLHYQYPTAQGKLVSVLRGQIYDVFVDIRRQSPTYGQWGAVHLDESSGRTLFLEPGFAHGFLSLAEPSDVLYVLTEPYIPEENHALVWNDPELAIDWPMVPQVISERDAAALSLAQAAASGFL